MRKTNKLRLFFVCLVIVSLVGICYFTIVNFNKKLKEDRLADAKKQETHIEDKKEDIKPVSITISAAGDVTMGNYKGGSYYGSFDQEFEKQNGDFTYFLENVRSIFENDDLSIVNLEGPLTKSSEAQIKQFAFKGDPSYVNILKEGDIEATNLANNHSNDYYDKGFNDTKNILDQNNISYFGLNEKDIVDIKGVKVGMLGYKGWPEYYTKENLEKIKSDLDYMKENADMTIVFFHWGNENQYYPEKAQKDFAHYVIDNGADIVLGGHPHVVQGIEQYRGKTIAYSLGNFSFGGNKNPKDKDTFIYQQTFTFHENELTETSKPNIIPCSISSINSRNDYRPTILEGLEKDRVLNKIKSLSEPLSDNNK